MTDPNTIAPRILEPLHAGWLERFQADERDARGSELHERAARKLEAALATHSPTPAGASILCGGAAALREPTPLLAALAALERAGVWPRRLIDRGCPEGADQIARKIAARSESAGVEPLTLADAGALAFELADAFALVCDDEEREALLEHVAPGEWCVWSPCPRWVLMRARVGERAPTQPGAPPPAPGELLSTFCGVRWRALGDSYPGRDPGGERGGRS